MGATASQTNGKADLKSIVRLYRKSVRLSSSPPGCWVVLLSTCEDLDRSLELSGSAHQGVHLSFLCGLKEETG